MNAPMPIDQVYALQRDLEKEKHRADNSVARLEISKGKLREVRRELKQERAAVRTLNLEIASFRKLLVQVRWNGVAYESVCTVCRGIGPMDSSPMHSVECPVRVESLDTNTVPPLPVTGVVG